MTIETFNRYDKYWSIIQMILQLQLKQSSFL